MPDKFKTTLSFDIVRCCRDGQPVTPEDALFCEGSINFHNQEIEDVHDTEVAIGQSVLAALLKLGDEKLRQQPLK